LVYQEDQILEVHKPELKSTEPLPTALKASADTRLMRGTGLVPELFKIGSEVRIVSETEIKSTVGFEINSVAGSGILTGLRLDRFSKSLEEVSSSDGNSFRLAKTD
jgi:hypothetical protein